MSRVAWVVGRIVVVTGVLMLVPAPSASEPGERAERERRLAEMGQEISRFENELAELASREQSLIGELERLGAELRLREREYDRVTLRLEKVSGQMDEHDRNLVELGEVQDERRRYLAFRIRETYKAGSNQWIRRFIGGSDADSYWNGLSYATFLSARDVDVLQAFRVDSIRESVERQGLERTRARIEELQSEARQSRDVVAAARRQRSSAVRRVRDDRGQRRAALDELQMAADALSGLIDALPGEEAARRLDIRKFKGLLEWPTEGQVASAFGTVVHPRFGTEVPHPGWDIDAEFGADIATVFDGAVVFADWMRGYGLTVIVDHGGGLMSIYAHASVLLVGAGQEVSRGQSLGKIGDTGSLRGSFLYFELRLNGRPVDPAAWLRRR